MASGVGTSSETGSAMTSFYTCARVQFRVFIFTRFYAKRRAQSRTNVESDHVNGTNSTRRISSTISQFDL